MSEREHLRGRPNEAGRALEREEPMRTGDGEPLEEHGYLPERKPARRPDLPPEQELGENPDEIELEP